MAITQRQRSVEPEIRDPRETGFKVPSFASRINRELTPIEKMSITDRFSGMDDPTQREILKHISTSLIQEEYQRREKSVKAALGEIKFKISTGLKYQMTVDQMKTLLDEINAIITKEGEDYGNK